MKLAIISDTHCHHRKINVPDADVLIHCGDFTMRGEPHVIEDFCNWMSEQPHKHKIVISGNHELGMQASFKRDFALEMIANAGVTYLEDSGIEIDGVKFYGAPWQPFYFNWEFNLPRGEALAAKWALIPDDVNVLITHGPPYGILDIAPRGKFDFEHAGCEELMGRIMQLKKLKLHCFGHIHIGYGMKEVDGVTFVNAAICTETRQPTNASIEVEI